MNELKVFDCPLEGTTLIEASAGTGKTWNLCVLVLRMVLERGWPLNEVLVVTFTQAATAELYTRLLGRLLETRDHLDRPGLPSADPLVPTLLQRLAEQGVDTAVVRQRLDLALQQFDEAAVHTIHGFCQRALGDTPLAGLQALDLSAVTDDRDLHDEAARDAWRRQFMHPTLDPALQWGLMEAGDLPTHWGGWTHALAQQPQAQARWPHSDSPLDPTAWADWEASVAGLQALWRDQGEAFADWMRTQHQHLHGNKLKSKTLEQCLADWAAWMASPCPALAEASFHERWTLLSQARIRELTKQNRPAVTHVFLAQVEAAEAVWQRLKAHARALRCRALQGHWAALRPALPRLKQQRGEITFHDLLLNLDERLQGPTGPALAEGLRRRYRAALIDEFQDTDPLQYRIFNTVWGEAGRPLLLMGDPKQAIYSFRQADLPTYLRAAQAAQHRWVLSNNQRSTPEMIAAVNALWSANPDPFDHPDLAFHPVRPGTRPRPRYEADDGHDHALALWDLARPDGGLIDGSDAAQDAAARATAADIARVLAAARDGRVRWDGRALQARDIAVLVRSHVQARKVSRALNALGVGCSERSQDSVFASDEARELLWLLRSVSEPTRHDWARTARSTRLWGETAEALQQGRGEDDRAAWEQREADRRLWAQQGVGVMLRRWAARHGLVERLLGQAQGHRRLTNVNHLLERLQAEAVHRPRPDALLKWLEHQCQDPPNGEADTLRLDSDLNLVQVVTVHKSKGLEYPVVYCPFLWAPTTPPKRSEHEAWSDHDEQGHAVVDLRGGHLDPAEKKAVNDRLRRAQEAEQRRLLYVALTRAVSRCVLVVGTCLYGSQKTTDAVDASALNRLVAREGLSTRQAWQAWSGALATATVGTVHWQTLPTGAGRPLPPQPLEAPAGWPSLAPQRPWRTTSFSALVHGARHESAARDHDHALNEAPQPTGDDSPPSEDGALAFPRGAAAGTFLHRVLELADFTDDTTWPAAVTQAQQECPVAGWDDPAPAVLPWLAQLLNTPLAVGTDTPLRLSTVGRAQRMVELEFHLPLPGVHSSRVQHWMAAHGWSGPDLSATPLEGFLKGYIDLVLEHEGRVFVLDWKSNFLGHRPVDYERAALDRAMASQGYHLQHLLYGLAVQRLLALRLGPQAAPRAWGGAIYLFMRGVRPDWVGSDGQATGCWHHRLSDEEHRSWNALWTPEPDGERGRHG